MDIQKKPYQCLQCSHEWEAETVINAPIEVHLASMRAVRCPGCHVRIMDTQSEARANALVALTILPAVLFSCLTAGLLDFLDRHFTWCLRDGEYDLFIALIPGMIWVLFVTWRGLFRSMFSDRRCLG